MDSAGNETVWISGTVAHRQAETLRQLRVRIGITECEIDFRGKERRVDFELDALRDGALTIDGDRPRVRCRDTDLRVLPVDVEDVRRIPQAIVELTLRPDFVVVSLIRLVVEDRRRLLVIPR